MISTTQKLIALYCDVCDTQITDIQPAKRHDLMVCGDCAEVEPSEPVIGCECVTCELRRGWNAQASQRRSAKRCDECSSEIAGWDA